ncbi:hypothetical protein LINPERPRIM_LOCUS37698, partial [Linum perenne]
LLQVPSPKSDSKLRFSTISGINISINALVTDGVDSMNLNSLPLFVPHQSKFPSLLTQTELSIDDDLSPFPQLHSEFQPCFDEHGRRLPPPILEL